MSEDKFPLAEFLQNDDRYPFEAYMFVREGLNYAVEVLQMGQNPESDLPPSLPEPPVEPPSAADLPSLADASDCESLMTPSERHLTGQELCEALRQYAVHQYGLMAKVVLSNWGVTATGDFGEIVFNMIKVGLMKKSDQDRREHFDKVFDFDVAFEQQFQINQPAIFWPS